MKKKKKRTLKKITNKKYAVKRSKLLILRDSPVTATYGTSYLRVSPKKVLSHISETPYFQKGDFVLYNADCLKILEQLPENSIDMIFADPPYFLSSSSFTCQNGKMVSVKKGDWDLSNGLYGINF